MIIEGKKGEQGKEWCGTSNECYEKMDRESEKRTLEFIRKNAKAGKPFFVQYWPNFLNFLKPDMPKKTHSGGKVAEAFGALDAFVGQVMEELKELGIAENTLFIAMADNGPMVHSPPPGWGMLPMLYRGGKGDFTEGGVRVPAFAWWPGVIEEGQVVGDIIHVTDLYTTFARLGGAMKYIPTDRVVDGLDQTATFSEWRHPWTARLCVHLRRPRDSAQPSKGVTRGTGSVQEKSLHPECRKPISTSTRIPGKRTL